MQNPLCEAVSCECCIVVLLFSSFTDYLHGFCIGISIGSSRIGHGMFGFAGHFVLNQRN